MSRRMLGTFGFSMALATFLLTGCATTPHAPPAAKPVATNSDDDDQERPRNYDFRSRDLGPRQGDVEHDLDEIHQQFMRHATADLKLRVDNLEPLLRSEYGLTDLHLRTPTGDEIKGEHGEHIFEELMVIKAELHQRWQKGETAASLPEFK